MTSDYERREFWTLLEKTKVKITKCNNEKSWYYDRVGQIFEVDSTSARDYRVKENNSLRCILRLDAEILN